jgi:hypothetical protein
VTVVAEGAGRGLSGDRGGPKLLDRLRTELRLRHRSLPTERSYCDWVKRYVRFHEMRHPSEMGAAEITAFLSYLAEDRQVAAATQNQDLPFSRSLPVALLPRKSHGSRARPPLAEVDPRPARTAGSSSARARTSSSVISPG